ncbi:AAA family ATPase [Dyella sp. EPa41]|uniref:AAA family ATPase n=1 Tax=Dyella sp. EPa41 TaxID=1561194 RepID=UPI0019157C60|nr:AAA family ATPase [Dyella sp. EPa41]
MTNPQNSNASLAGEAKLENMRDESHVHATAGGNRLQVLYSRGYGERDNTPEQRFAPDFTAFRDAILDDRGTEKGGRWIAGPCAIAPDDASHRDGGSKQRAIGKHHRCASCAHPRRFIGLDVDQSLTPQSFAALVQHLQRFSGLVFTTSSHTPASPRCRVILELDLPAPRAELVAATAAVQKRISDALVADGYDPLIFDASCDRPEQPLYLPLTGASHYLLDGKPLSLGELLADMPALAQKPTQAPSQPAGAVVVDEGRHGDLLALSGRRARDVHRGDMDADTAWALLVAERDRGRWTRRMDDAELRRAFEGSLAKLASGAWEAPAPVPGVAVAGKQAANDATGNNVRRLFTLTRADKIERKATDWLIRDYLVRDTLAALIAKPGACKSFLAVDWACRIATGTAWYGREVKPGAVFYLAGEGQRGLRKRIDGWEKHTGVTVDGAPLFIASGMPFLCDQLNIASTLSILKETAEELRTYTGVTPAMIVIDTVARAMNGANENATDDMGKFVSACDQLRQEWNCTVLAVHHTGNDPGAQDRGRGNSNFGASMDSDFYLKAKDGGLELKSGDKAKDWRKPPTVMLSKVEIEVESIDDDGEPVKETTLALHDAAGAIADTSKRDRVVGLHRDGLSIRAIADHTGVPATTIHRWLKHAA